MYGNDSSTWSRPLILLVLMLGALTPHLAAAKASKKGTRGPAKLAVVLTGKDSALNPLIDGFTEQLFQAATRVDQINLMTDAALSRGLREDPKARFAACGTNIKCIAKITRKAKVGAALYGRWLPGSPATLQYLVVAASGKLQRKGTLTLASVADAPQAVAENFRALLGVTAPSAVRLTNNQGPVSIDGTTVGTGPGPFAVQPGRRSVACGGAPQSVVVFPGQTLDLTTEQVSPEPPAAPAAPPEAPAAMQSAFPDAPAPPQAPAAPEALAQVEPPGGPPAAHETLSEATEHPLAPFVASLVLLGGGAAVCGVGIGYGAHAHQLRDQVNTSADLSTDQANVLIGQSNQAASRANLLTGVGGGVAGAGALLYLLQAFGVFDREAAAPTLSAGAGQASIGLRGRW